MTFRRNFRPNASAAVAATLTSALAAAFLCAPALAQDSSKAPAKPAPAVPSALTAPPAAASGPLATVNGVAIPRQRGELMLRQHTQQGRPDTPQVRNEVRERLIALELVTQEANRTGFTKKPEFQSQLQSHVELVRQNLIAEAYVLEWAKQNPITDADLQKEYDKRKAQMGDKEYKARHILVGTEEEAKGLIAELKKGGKFEELAKKSSKDEGTKDKGGELDWQLPTGYAKDFADAMVKLTKGKMTEAPVKSRFGFHVIQLDDTRAIQIPPFAEVKANISQGMNGARIQKLLADLRAKAKIE